ncbi:NAD kinase 2 [Actinidia rufa]|uniref:NAD kinase 2 n=1 Tax=Actinidia rufa TaxID=165716 RepID=A0A7J0FCZ1_9ERIC|nr:NAD kinase 2 [Actinidia rufa]
MNRSTATHICSLKFQQLIGANKVSGFGLQRNERFFERRRVRFVVSAKLSKHFSVNFGLDSKTFQSHDLSQLPRIGPLPGDITEVEAYCRIFRAAERLHNVLMHTLCNPLTGECSVSYNFPSEDKPLLEDKIVSILGCMVCLLNKGKEDVLSGRSSMLNTFHVTDINVRDDKLPPFAIFRGEMKRYCESLHVALENYLTPDDNRSLSVWRKLQRLKSVCYDSGFPRGDGDPCHTLFANWNPVYLSTSKEDIYTTDSEVAFWRGSQVTEEGLKWLMEKGFKTIVDLRAEAVQDGIYETALEDAIFSGKVELVKLPVEVGTAPSSEQVEKFAALVSNSRKNAIYLHSREGVWRTSAMVSRWRQYMARYASQLVSNHATTQRDKMEELSTSNLEEDAFIGDGNGLLPKQLGMTRDNTGKVLNHMSLGTDNKDVSCNEAYSGFVSHQDTMSVQSVNHGELRSLSDFTSKINPLKSQLPPCNVFSRKEMSRFFKNNKMSTSCLLQLPSEEIEACYPQRENFNGTFLGSEIIGTSPELQLMETGSKNGSTSSKTLALKSHSPPVSKETYLSDNGHSSSDPNLNGFGKGERYPVSAVTDPLNVSNGLYKNVISITDDQKHNSEAFTVPGDDGLGMIEGDMCASATGVIRIQSRRKVEMFLVRTDGFSCSREKVTESSLAFTHPSTQQQMLICEIYAEDCTVVEEIGPRTYGRS